MGSRWVRLAGMILAVALAGMDRAVAATITVNSTNDPAGFSTTLTVGTLGTNVTLRDAVTAANNTPGDDTITFAPALAGQTIFLAQAGLDIPYVGGTVTNHGRSALYVTSNIAFQGPAGGQVTLQKDPGVGSLTRLFMIAPGATVSVTGLKLFAGTAGNAAGAWNEGSLTLDACTVVSCNAIFFFDFSANGQGGGVYNLGSLTVRSSQFSFCSAGNLGAGIFNAPGGTFTVTNSTFSNGQAQNAGGAIANSDSGGGCRIDNSYFLLNSVLFATNMAAAPYAGGGAIANAGTLRVANSTFATNSSVFDGGAFMNIGTAGLSACTFVSNAVYAFGPLTKGGALANDGTLGATNCTFQGNRGRVGGAIGDAGSRLSLVHCTVVGNVATNNGGTAVYLQLTNNVLDNTIVSGNLGWNAGSSSYVPGDVSGSFQTASTNFIGRTNLLLGVLTTNGGPVRTMALEVGSPAVNAGFAIGGPSTDARGQPRYEAPDLGAYELPTYAPIFTSPTSTIFVLGQSNSFQFTANSGLPVAFALITPLPAGLTLTTNGLLSGTSLAPSGLYPVTVRAFNAYNHTDTNFLIIVNDGTLADRYSWQLNNGAALTNGVFTLTDGGFGQSRSAWYLFKQDINAFQASFEYLDAGGGGADGMAFVLQNDADGVGAIGGGGGGLGYLGIAPSFALMINVYAGAPGGPGIQLSTGGSGLGTNVYIATPAANPASGNPIRFDLYYLNGVLNVAMSNLTSNTTFTTNFVVDIPGAVLGNQAWIGLTAATGGGTATQRVSNFSFSPLSATAIVVVTDAADPAGFSTNLIFSTLGTNVTLRDALTAANNYPGPSAIRFAPHLAGATISLLQTGDAGTGLTALPINKSIVIENTNALPLTIRRGAAGDLRLFRVFSGGGLTLRNLQLSGGQVGSFGQYGGLVHNAGTLTVERCTMSGGYSGGGGGGLYNSGTMSLSASALSSNVTGIGQGYGVGGGGILNQGTMTLTNCTLAYNAAPNSYGGAVWNTAGSMSFYSCTIAGNSAFAFGSGIGANGQPNALCRNCIIADSSSFSLLGGSASNLFYNPGLGAFGSNGGPTPTFPITAASAAHKAGEADPALTTDQRGVTRHSPPDIGAYELFPRDPLIVTTTIDENDGSADSTQGTGTSLREALIYAQSLGGSQTITFAASLAGQTVVLGTGWTNTADASALRVTNIITISGLSSAPGITLAIAPAVQKRHFLIEAGGSLTLQDLALTGGYAADFGGSVWNLSGSLTVRRCTFAGNSSGGEGGAIHAWGGVPLLVIENSTFVSNTAASLASAIGTGAVSNSFKHLTVTANSCPNGTFWLYNTVVPLHNSIVAGNTSDSAATFGTGAFAPDSFGNVFGSGNAAGLTNGVNSNVTGASAGAILAGGLSISNGGPTPTVALQANGPAVNRGTNFAGIATDQRGQARVSLGAPDAGAYELIAVESSLVTTTNDEFNGTSDARFGTGTSLREAVYCTASIVDVSTNLSGQTIELTMVGDTQFGNTAILLTNTSTRFIRGGGAERVSIRAGGAVPMRHFRVGPGAAVALLNFVLSGGQATNGGAVYNQGTAFFTRCTLVSNAASEAGGAVFVDTNAALVVRVSTFTCNSAGLWGGAVANRGTNLFHYTTIAANRTGSGGGAIYNEAGSAPSTLEGTIVAANTNNVGASSDIGGPSAVSANSSYNLIGTGGSGGLANGVNSNFVGVANPGLAPLGDYGGRMLTMALYPWSPAVDVSYLVPQVSDQRGFVRAAPYDIGAYELLRSTNGVTLGGLKRNVTGGGAGALEFDFAGGVTGSTFSVYATTNALIPAHQWQWIGLVPETPPGSAQFRASLPLDTNASHRIYRVQSP